MKYTDSPDPTKHKQGVSVIVCAKNESAQLAINLPLILQQNFITAAGLPYFEVIVVDDASTDDTATLLLTLQNTYKHLKVITLPQNSSRILKGKKHALSKGVAAAKYNWLALTDADCIPASNQWLSLITAPLAVGKEIVAGYGGYNTRKGLLNSFVRWETLHTFLQYSSYAQAGLPYMAVGRNMACTKQVLEAAQQSDIWNALPSGDDDLLVRITGTGSNTAIVCHPLSFTYTEAKPDLKSWARQKQRHLSTGKYYKAGIKALLGGYALSHSAFWCSFFLLLPYAGTATVLFMGLRCSLYWALWSATAYKTREKNLLFFLPVFDIGWLVYNFAFLPYITWKNKQQWI